MPAEPLPFLDIIDIGTASSSTSISVDFLRSFLLIPEEGPYYILIGHTVTRWFVRRQMFPSHQIYLLSVCVTQFSSSHVPPMLTRRVADES